MVGSELELSSVRRVFRLLSIGSITISKVGNEARVRRENIIAKPALSVLEKEGSKHFVEGLCYVGLELPLVPCRPGAS